MGEVITDVFNTTHNPEAIEAMVSVHSLYNLIRQGRAGPAALVTPAQEASVYNTLFTISDHLSWSEAREARQTINHNLQSSKEKEK